MFWQSPEHNISFPPNGQTVYTGIDMAYKIFKEYEHRNQEYTTALSLPFPMFQSTKKITNFFSIQKWNSVYHKYSYKCLMRIHGRIWNIWYLFWNMNCYIHKWLKFVKNNCWRQSQCISFQMTSLLDPHQCRSIDAFSLLDDTDIHAMSKNYISDIQVLSFFQRSFYILNQHF